jgi:hypothetical protein
VLVIVAFVIVAIVLVRLLNGGVFDAVQSVSVYRDLRQLQQNGFNPTRDYFFFNSALIRVLKRKMG